MAHIKLRRSFHRMRFSFARYRSMKTESSKQPKLYAVFFFEGILVLKNQ